jgi:DNA-binding sugar fermentation-stimulating protein
MKYADIVEGIFLKRPNRFIAEVLIDGRQHSVHVKNTGRCREILIEGTRIYLQESDNPKRKTRKLKATKIFFFLKGKRLSVFTNLNSTTRQ